MERKFTEVNNNVEELAVEYKSCHTRMEKCSRWHVHKRNIKNKGDKTLAFTTCQQAISWTFEGAVMDPSSYESLTYPGDHNTTIHQLSLSRASARNIGTYQCITPYGSKETAVEMYSECRLSDFTTLTINNQL